MLEKLEQDIIMKGYSKKTLQSYMHINQKFLELIKKHPKDITINDLNNYKFRLIKQNKSEATINLTVAALKYFYANILRKKKVLSLKRVKKKKQCPYVLSREQILKLIQHTNNPKHKLIIKLLYDTGIRLNELINIKINDIDFSGNRILIKKGKGNKTRFVVISETLKNNILNYLNSRNNNNIFLLDSKTGHLCARSVEELLIKAKKKAKITCRVFPHALRASFATHMAELNVNIKYIQLLMGHENIDTTYSYIKYAQPHKVKLPSVLENIEI